MKTNRKLTALALFLLLGAATCLAPAARADSAAAAPLPVLKEIPDAPLWDSRSSII